jgi:hypothetical protein
MSGRMPVMQISGKLNSKQRQALTNSDFLVFYAIHMKTSSNLK